MKIKLINDKLIYMKILFLYTCCSKNKINTC